VLLEEAASDLLSTDHWLTPCSKPRQIFLVSSQKLSNTNRFTNVYFI
jgi:hypothetical protein